MLIQSESIDLDTPTGKMRTYIHRPTKSGKFPVILFYSEIFHQTGPIERAAKIVASQGYAVLVPEVFHELNPIGTVLNYDDACSNEYIESFCDYIQISKTEFWNKVYKSVNQRLFNINPNGNIEPKFKVGIGI